MLSQASGILSEHEGGLPCDRGESAFGGKEALPSEGWGLYLTGRGSGLGGGLSWEGRSLSWEGVCIEGDLNGGGPPPYSRLVAGTCPTEMHFCL